MKKFVTNKIKQLFCFFDTRYFKTLTYMINRIQTMACNVVWIILLEFPYISNQFRHKWSVYTACFYFIKSSWVCLDSFDASYDLFHWTEVVQHSTSANVVPEIVINNQMVPDLDLVVIFEYIFILNPCNIVMFIKSVIYCLYFFYYQNHYLLLFITKRHWLNQNKGNLQSGTWRQLDVVATFDYVMTSINFKHTLSFIYL